MSASGDGDIPGFRASHRTFRDLHSSHAAFTRRCFVVLPGAFLLASVMVDSMVELAMCCKTETAEADGHGRWGGTPIEGTRHRSRTFPNFLNIVPSLLHHAFLDVGQALPSTFGPRKARSVGVRRLEYYRERGYGDQDLTCSLLCSFIHRPFCTRCNLVLLVLTISTVENRKEPGLSDTESCVRKLLPHATRKCIRLSGAVRQA